MAVEPESRALEPTMICVKYLILAFNCIFVLTGILLIVVGSSITGLFSNFDLLLDSDFISPATFMIAVGIIIFAVSLFGAVGAARESTCLINAYTACLVVIFIFELSAGFAGFAMQGSISKNLETNMINAIQNKYHTNSSEFNEWKDTIDLIQSNLECCGANSPADWEGVFPTTVLIPIDVEGDKIIVPDSCCGTINSSTATCDEPYVDGCLPSLGAIARTNAVLLTMTALTISIIQAMGIYYSNSLAKAIRRAKNVRAMRQIEIRNQLANSYQPMTKTNEQILSPVIYLTGGGQADATA